MMSGIYLEQRVVIAKYDELDGVISFVHFKRANPHIKIVNDALNISIGKIQYVEYLFNLLSGVMLGLVGTALISFSVENETLFQFLAAFGVGGVLVVIGLVLFSQTLPVISAKKIIRAIKAHSLIIEKEGKL